MKKGDDRIRELAEQKGLDYDVLCAAINEYGAKEHIYGSKEAGCQAASRVAYNDLKALGDVEGALELREEAHKYVQAAEEYWERAEE